MSNQERDPNSQQYSRREAIRKTMLPIAKFIALPAVGDLSARVTTTLRRGNQEEIGVNAQLGRVTGIAIGTIILYKKALS